MYTCSFRRIEASSEVIDECLWKIRGFWIDNNAILLRFQTLTVSRHWVKVLVHLDREVNVKLDMISIWMVPDP